jgi:hypothetical protein
MPRSLSTAAILTEPRTWKRRFRFSDSQLHDSADSTDDASAAAYRGAGADRPVVAGPTDSIEKFPTGWGGKCWSQPLPVTGLAKCNP